MHSHSLVFSLGVHKGVRVYLILACVSAIVLMSFSEVVPYECPQLSLLIITSALETNKIEPRSYLIIPC